MIPVVLDTNAALDLLHFGDPRCEALRAALARGEATVCTNAVCRAEFVRVLRYPMLALDAARIAQLQAAYDTLAEMVDDTRDAPLPRCRDRDDQCFLELARDARAELLLTRDAELLRLSRRTQRDAGFRIAPPEHFALAPR